jgi:hypothetical protein
MVCVLVPLLLNRNIGVLFGVLRGPRSDFPLFLACYDSAYIVWVYMLSLYFCDAVFIWNLSHPFLPVSLLCLVVSSLLCFEALFCRVLCSTQMMMMMKMVSCQKHVQAINIYKLNHTGRRQQLLYNLLLCLPLECLWSERCFEPPALMWAV